MKTGGRRFRKRGVIFYIGNILSAQALSRILKETISGVDDDKSLSLETPAHPPVIADGNLYAGCNIQHQNIGRIKIYFY